MLVKINLYVFSYCTYLFETAKRKLTDCLFEYAKRKLTDLRRINFSQLPESSNHLTNIHQYCINSVKKNFTAKPYACLYLLLKNYIGEHDCSQYFDNIDQAMFELSI